MAAVDAPASFEMRGVRRTFGATVAVDHVDLAVRPGEVCALVGQNGAGKSTLMSILAGALRPEAGTLWLRGEPFRPRRPLDARRAGIAMIHQELSLAPHLTVMENILLGDEPARAGIVRWEAMRGRTRQALARLGRSDISPDTIVGDLSLPAQQMVEIARALATGARVLVMDEPTSSLGRDDVRRLFDVIAQLKRDGHAIVYISHFLEEVREVADRIVVLRDGRVTATLPATAPASDIVAAMVGQGLEQLYPRSPRQRGEPLLTIDDRGESAGLTLHRGEIVGIAGLVGAGRTRLVRTLFQRRQWAQGVGMLSEDRKGEGLAVSLSIADNLTLSKLDDFGPGPLVFPARQDRAAGHWIDRVKIRARSPRQAVEELSGGNQQKVALARLLHHDVDVLLLDEPTRGIDVASKAQIYALLDGLVAASAAKPRGILLVSSYFPELLGLCDRIAVMRKGRLGPARPASELTEHQLVLEATGAEDQ
jgi:ribose transport system ATP-binding protein